MKSEMDLRGRTPEDRYLAVGLTVRATQLCGLLAMNSDTEQCQPT
jgi:hypothetical protein